MSRVSPPARLILAVALSSGLPLLVGSPAAADETLGRLFFTPERRQQLDRQRELNILDRQQLPADPTLIIDGVVVRSSGKRTAWVNGSPQHENDPWNGLAVTPRHGDPARVMIETSDSPAARARVGQTVNRNTGEATDLLNGGQLQVHSRSPGAK
ncbi:MAG: hypothetical protein H6942_12580 [Candidatus Accumulibacter sp.]|uniref:hypothetical protein n=1 Tax=Accumulibacter sp. TaxID=2053492 RepID=UPI0025D33FC5|nr:hypothetical protein [Accumulibacter sp.]MCP5249348.1 hypothetical protein [Accumulibacter sp.]